MGKPVPKARSAPRRRVWSRGRIIGGVVMSVLLLGFLLFAVFPSGQWWQQRKDTAQVQADLDEVRAAKARVEQEQALLRTEAEIARRAKEEFGYVNPGEDAYNILPAPTDPIGLPAGWPFIGVERVFGTG